MEYCQGGDLAKIIKKHKDAQKYISEEFIWKVFMQLVLALYECHKQDRKVLHRDIKPHNIFLDSHKNVKLGDFGLAKALTSKS